MWAAFGFISIAFHIFLIFSGLIPNLISRPIHMALILPWIFLYNQKVSSSIINTFIVTIGVFCCLWIAFNHEILTDQYGFLEGNFQFLISIILLLIVLEMARRSVTFCKFNNYYIRNFWKFHSWRIWSSWNSYE